MSNARKSDFPPHISAKGNGSPIGGDPHRPSDDTGNSSVDSGEVAEVAVTEGTTQEVLRVERRRSPRVILAQREATYRNKQGDEELVFEPIQEGSHLPECASDNEVTSDEMEQDNSHYHVHEEVEEQSWQNSPQWQQQGFPNEQYLSNNSRHLPIVFENVENDTPIELETRPESRRKILIGVASLVMGALFVFLIDFLMEGRPTFTSTPIGDTTHIHRSPVIESRMSTIELISDPTDSELIHQGAVIGNTPIRIKRPTHKQFYLLRQPGYKPQLIRISPDSDERIRITLQRAYTETNTKP